VHKIGTAFSGSDNLSSIWKEKYAHHQSSQNLEIIEPSSSVEADMLAPIKVTGLNRTLGFSTKSQLAEWSVTSELDETSYVLL
jgi:hypothetical protein